MKKQSRKKVEKVTDGSGVENNTTTEVPHLPGTVAERNVKDNGKVDLPPSKSKSRRDVQEMEELKSKQDRKIPTSTSKDSTIISNAETNLKEQKRQIELSKQEKRIDKFFVAYRHQAKAEDDEDETYSSPTLSSRPRRNAGKPRPQKKPKREKTVAVSSESETSHINIDQKGSTLVADAASTYSLKTLPEPALLKPSLNEPKKTNKPSKTLQSPKTKSQLKSNRVRHYKHFIHATHIFENRYGSSHSSDSLVSDSSISDELKPDMSWILKSDSNNKSTLKSSEKQEETDTNQANQAENNKQNRAFHNSLTVLVRTLQCLGRMPFKFTAHPDTGLLECNVMKGIQKIVFILVTIILLMAFVSTTLSVLSIVFRVQEVTDKSDEIAVSAESYENFEKLLLQKHWMHAVSFLCTLLIAVITSISMIVSGKVMADYVNRWAQAISTLQYEDASNGIRLIGYVNLIWAAIDIVIWYSVIYTNTFAFKESNKFLTILMFRWVIPHRFAYHSIYVDVLQHGVLFFQIYIFFATRSMIGLLLLFCRAIVNVAHHWNLRIALMLNKIIPSADRPDLVTLQESLTHKRMLKDHFLIVTLVRGFSESFVAICCGFFVVQILAITCQLFSIATAVLFDLKLDHASGTVTNSDVKYESTPEETAFGIIYFLSTTILLINVVSLSTSAVGETVMSGFDPIRRYGLMLANSAQERKFVMSLTMSFNAKNPYVLNPGRFFKIDRSLIMAILAGAFMIFSIMIQCKVVNLVDVAIVLPCEGNTGALCVSSRRDNDLDRNPTVSPIILPTTTTKPPLHCPKAPPSRNWVSMSDKLLEKQEKCGVFCAKTNVFRMIPRNEKGIKNSALEKELIIRENDKIISCIVDPYKTIPNNAVYYDCFGNCFNKRDSCGQYGWNLNNSPMTLQKVKNVVASGGFTGKCYQPNYPDDPNLNKDHEEAHPLEICGLPYPIVNSVCSGKTIPRDFMFDPDSFWSIKITGKPKCIEVPPPVNPLEANYLSTKRVYEFGKPPSNIPTIIDLLIPYSYIYGTPGRQVPHVRNSNNIQLNYLFPYTYIGSQFIRKKGYWSSFGYYDCFGEKLASFDDCGGLQFSIFDGTRHRRPGREVVTVTDDNGENAKTFSCYESWIPNYKCGMPQHRVDLIRDRCNNWQKHYPRP